MSRTTRAAVLDVVAVVAFVVIGRRSHDEGSAIAGTFRIVAPFLIALAVAWLVARAWRSAAEIRTGVAVWAVTVVVGLALRRTVFDRGIAPAFVIVTTIVLGAFLLGWRAVHRAVLRRSPPRSRPGSGSSAPGTPVTSAPSINRDGGRR